MLTRSLSHRAPLLYLVLPFAAGIALQRTTGLNRDILLLACAVAFAAAAIAMARIRRGWFIFPALALACAGAAAASRAQQRLAAWESLPPRDARLLLEIRQVYHSSDPSRTSAIASVMLAPAPLRAIEGQRIYVSISRPAAAGPLLPSAEITATGLLTPLGQAATPGSFDRSLVDAGVNFRLNRARIQSIAREADWYNRTCDSAARWLGNVLGIGIASRRPDLTAIYRAMLLGWQGELSPEQHDVFVLSGTMHLFSVSGLHVVVISQAITALLAALRLPRPISTVATLAIVAAHVVLTGSSPAAVRAFLLVFFHESAFLLRQPGNAHSALAMASLVVLLVDPLALFSASFQMSYGAVLAIVTYGGPLGEKLAGFVRPDPALPAIGRTSRQRFWQEKLGDTAKIAAVGFAATLVGAISGITYFRVLSPISLLVNMAVIPIANGVIVSGAIAIGCGLAGFSFGCDLFNHAAGVILWAVDQIVRFSVDHVGGWWGADWRTDWIGSFALTLLVATLLAGYALKWEKRYGGFWTPIILTALLVALGAKFS